MRGGSVWRTWLQPRLSQTQARPQSPRPTQMLKSDSSGHNPGSTGIDARQSALVVIDCQPEALRSIADSEELLFHTNTAIDTVRRQGGHIAFVRLAFDELDYQSVPSTNTEASALARDRCFQNGTPDAGLHRSLAVHNQDIVVKKTRLGVFSTTNLDERLTNLGITTLILAGVHTSGAVLSTVRDAADRDYRLVVLSDCTSDTDPSAHDLCLDRVIPRQAEVLNTSNLDRYLTRGALRRDSELQVG